LCVSRSTFYLKYTSTHFHYGNIKSPPAKVKDEDLQILVCFVKAISKGRGSWFINNSNDLETSYLASILGGLPFALAGFLLVTNPKYLSPLVHDPLGVTFVVAASALMLVGFAWMRRIVRVEV